MKLFYILVFFLFVRANAQTQEQLYDISVNGITVGELSVSKVIEGSKTVYKLNSKSVISLFTKTTITTSLICEFKDNVLEWSTYVSKKNGKPYDNSTITKSDGLYTVTRKEKTASISKPIKYVTCMLYFEKPITNESYFDVLEGVFSPVKIVDQNNFLYVDSSNNEKTTYNYLNGTLQQGSTKHALYDFTFTLRR